MTLTRIALLIPQIVPGKKTSFVATSGSVLGLLIKLTEFAMKGRFFTYGTAIEGSLSTDGRPSTRYVWNK